MCCKTALAFHVAAPREQRAAEPVADLALGAAEAG